MHHYVLLRMRKDVIVDVIGLGSARSYTEALSRLSKRVGHQPAADWVTVGLCKPSKGVDTTEDPVQKMRNDFRVAVAPTLVVQCTGNDYSKRLRAKVRRTHDKEWASVLCQRALDYLVRCFSDIGADDRPAPGYDTRVINNGAGLAPSSTKEPDKPS